MTASAGALSGRHFGRARLLRPVVTLLIILGSTEPSPPVLAHIGSPNVFYEGVAGPYALRVIVQPPEVIPGRAQVHVRVLDGNVSKVSVLPARWDTGTKGAPAPDVAKRIRGDTNLFSAELWLMNSGAYSILVNAEGPAGAGTTVVPLNSIATTRREMPRWFGTMLGIWAGTLLIAMICLVGVAARESVLRPGDIPDHRRVWRARAAMVLAALVIAAALWGGKAWWDSVDKEYRNNRLYRADKLRGTFRTNDTQLVLHLQRSAERGNGRPLVPEHGKFMHAFLMRQPGLDVFAHLHPLRIDNREFDVTLPPLHAGKYKLYADITHESGFTQTLVSEVELPQPLASGSWATSDADDSWCTSSNAPANVNQLYQLAGGFTMRHVGTADSRLQFTVMDKEGKPALLDAYMDMQAHAVICNRDGTVFTHLHPFGTISMTSQQLFAKRERERFGKPFEIVCGLPSRADVISFPYEFPKPGDYRVWVQVKVSGQIMTGVFDIAVNDT
jgi:hypothetical protein